MKAFDLSKNKEIDSNNLTDAQSVMLDEVSAASFDQIKKANGSYFIWACIPESQKVAIKSCLMDSAAWASLIHSMNETLKYYSDGKVELVLVEKDGSDTNS